MRLITTILFARKKFLIAVVFGTAMIVGRVVRMVSGTAKSVTTARLAIRCRAKAVALNLLTLRLLIEYGAG